VSPGGVVGFLRGVLQFPLGHFHNIIRALPYSPRANNCFALRRDIGIVKYIFIQRLRGFRGLAKIKFRGWLNSDERRPHRRTAMSGDLTDAHIHVQAQAHQHTCTRTTRMCTHTHKHLFRHWLG
jgi:hypothetical protein